MTFQSTREYLRIKKEGLMFEIYFLVFGLDFALVLGLGFGFVKFFMFRTAIL